MSKNFLKKKKNGFTLIELLVVIAIIGLLSSIVAIAAVSYRNKSRDGRIQAVLSQVRKEAALIYTESNSYTAVGNTICAANTLNEGNANHPDLAKVESDVMAQNGSQAVDCYATVSSFCVRSPLISKSGVYWCVDSIGYAGTTKPTCAAAAVCQ